MNKELLKKIGIVVGSVIGSIYVLFLVLPLFLNSIATSCGNFISSTVKDTTGLDIKLEKIKFVTTPKLTAGANIGHISILLPTGEEMLSAENLYGKISLLPFFAKCIEIDSIGSDNLSLALHVKKDGKFLLEDVFTQTASQAESTAETAAPMTELPFGIKLSNRLPNIHVKNYKLAFIDMPTKKEYYIQGEKFDVSDFILNKKIKVSTNGKVVFDERIPFNYDVKVFNKIMPDLDLNELIFASQNVETQQPTTEFNINVIDIFKTINKNQVTTDIKADVTTYGSLEDVNINGYINADNISIASDGNPLPNGHLHIVNKGKNIDINSSLYTAKDETTTITSKIKTGKNPKINITCKSNAQINNIFNLIDSIAKSVNYNDLETLSAKGGIDADFTINADMKKVHSTGYFKIPSASIRYALFNVLIDNIAADIDFANDSVNIKNFGFSILNQPLKAYGTIKQDTTADLHLVADKLPIKGLVTAAGQVALLKENSIKSGTISMDASVKGKLEKAQPVVNISADNIDILNIPSNTGVKVANSNVNLSTDWKTYNGSVDVNSVLVTNPMANISLPKANVKLNEKDILIEDTYLLLDNSRVDIAGKITDYANKNIAMNITAKGNLLASDLKSMIPTELRGYITGSGKIPVYAAITGNDKVQNIKAQILATPANYLNIISVNQLSGKNTLINSDLRLVNDSLKITNTGIYTTTATSLPVNTLSTPLASVAGSVDKLSTKQILNNININANPALTFAIPGFSNSKATAKANITLNGTALAPTFKGSIEVPTIEIPTIKTSLKNVIVDLNSKTILVNTPNITIDNSTMKAKTTVSTNFNNGVIVNSVDFSSDLLDSDTLIKAMAGLPAPTSSGTTVSTSSSSQNLGVIVQSGQGSIKRFKSGGIIGTNITSNFNVKNNTLYLKGMQGDAFNGKFNGDVSVNLINGNTNVDFHGTAMNAEQAIAGAAGLKNALSGTLGFNAKVSLNGYAPSEAAMMKSLKGSADFNIQNGTFGNIGRLETMLYAENIAANAIMKAALAPIVNMPVVQGTSHFKEISGNLTFNNGWADLKSIKSSGPSMSAFIYGKYNLLNASANITILGRLGAEVVKVLGPVGELSVNKLTAYIPKFGAATAKIINAMTTNPNGERISEIPALSNGNTNYKDFKVSFNGGVESSSSVKSFKWLSNCDTSSIESGSFKEQFQQTRQEQKEAIQKGVANVRDTAKQTSEEIKNQIQNTKDSINELKNLFKKPSRSTTTTTPAATGVTTP